MSFDKIHVIHQVIQSATWASHVCLVPKAHLCNLCTRDIPSNKKSFKRGQKWPQKTQFEESQFLANIVFINLIKRHKRFSQILGEIDSRRERCFLEIMELWIGGGMCNRRQKSMESTFLSSYVVAGVLNHFIVQS